jgi:hypothetical protein
MVSPEKLAEVFGGTLAVANFGVQSGTLQVAARKKVVLLKSAREMNTGIYIGVGFRKFSEFLNFRIYFLFFLKNSRKILKSYLSHKKSRKLEKILRNFSKVYMNVMIKIKSLKLKKRLLR